jgi:hypothetical protein
MEGHGPTGPSSALATTTEVRAFSKTILVTYVGLGLFAFLFLIGSLYDLYQAVTSKLPLLLIPCVVLLALSAGFIYVVLALHERRNWARYAVVSFWLLPDLDSPYDRAKWMAPRACSWSAQIFKRRTTCGRTAGRFGDAVFHGHAGIDGGLLPVAKNQRCESIREAC